MAAKRKASPKKPSKGVKTGKKAGKLRVTVSDTLSPSQYVLPKRHNVESRKIIVVYGMRVDPEKVAAAAVEAYNRKRYTVHDIRLMEQIEDPKFRNLMVKIAVLDRIEEDVVRLYPDAEVLRPNTVTLIIR
jgi:hypothetical protein